jgi:hypothetical protein
MENFPGEGWANFFAAETGAAATLSGLVFVAMSINLSRILAFPHLPRRAAETLALLVGALVVCSIGLVPGQSGAVVGTEYIVVGFVAWLFPTANLVRSFRLERLASVWRLGALQPSRNAALHGGGRRDPDRPPKRTLLAGGGRAVRLPRRRAQRLGAARRDHALMHGARLTI